MSHITLNVETIGDSTLPAGLYPQPDDFDAPSNYKDPAKIEEYKQNAARSEMGRFGLAPLTGKIICASYLYEDSDGKYEPIATIAGDNEASIVESLLAAISSHHAEFPTIVTYNGLQFDIPFIAIAAARCGIMLPVGYRDLLNRYGADHVDIYSLLSAYGAHKKGKLSDWSLRFGIEPPFGVGNMVTDWFRLGDWDSIKRHCESNVRCTDELYKILRAANFLGALRG